MQKIRRKIAFLFGPHKEAVIPKPPRAGAGSQGQGPCLSPVGFTATSSRREYCRRALRRAAPACSSFSLSFDASVFVIESTRRRVAVEATLENRGENAYSTVLNISFSRNLQFASLIPKVRHRGCMGSPCPAGEPKISLPLVNLACVRAWLLSIRGLFILETQKRFHLPSLN